MERGLLIFGSMGHPVRLNTSARAIALAIDEVLEQDVWLDALSDDDFENDVVINLANDDFVIEVQIAANDEQIIECIDVAEESSRAITQPAKPCTVSEPEQDYDAWYAAYLRGGRPEALPRSRAPRATSTMARPAPPLAQRADTTQVD